MANWLFISRVNVWHALGTNKIIVMVDPALEAICPENAQIKHKYKAKKQNKCLWKKSVPSLEQQTHGDLRLRLLPYV